MTDFSLGLLCGIALALVVFRASYRRPRCERCGTGKDVKVTITIDEEDVIETGVLCQSCHLAVTDELEAKHLAEMN